METFSKRGWLYWAAIAVLFYHLFDIGDPLLQWVLGFPLSEVIAAIPQMPWYAQYLLVVKVAVIIVCVMMLCGLAMRFTATRHLGIALAWIAVAEYIIRFQMIEAGATGRQYAEYVGTVIGKVIEVGIIAGLVFWACKPRDDVASRFLAPGK